MKNVLASVFFIGGICVAGCETGNIEKQMIISTVGVVMFLIGIALSINNNKDD